jgi:hypothetical protein
MTRRKQAEPGFRRAGRRLGRLAIITRRSKTSIIFYQINASFFSPMEKHNNRRRCNCV